MFEIKYKPTFVRQYKKLSEALKTEVKERIELLKEDPKHTFLKTHKLKGRLAGFWSCSVNYSHQMIFEYEDKNTIVLLSVGDHDVYKI